MIKERKRLNIVVVASLIVTLLITGLMPMTASADSIKPRIDEVEYKGSGKVKVEWDDDVRYRNTSVVVKSGGKTYKDTIVRKNEEYIIFDIKNFKRGKTYYFTIKNVRDEDHYRYYTVKGKVKIPKAATKIYMESVEYDAYDNEVDFEFRYDVRWKSPTVKFTDSDGNTINGRIIDRDSDSLEVYAPGMKNGAEYKYTITGVKRKYASSYRTYSNTFTAYDYEAPLYEESVNPSNPVTPSLPGTVVIEKVDYDYWDRDVEIDFLYNVNLTGATAVITDDSGNVVTTYVKSIDEDSIELYFPTNLTIGKTYTYTVYNVAAYGSTATETVSGTFVANYY